MRECRITEGRLQAGGGHGKPEIADYILVYKNQKIAVIEAKADELPATEGVAQAKAYADKLQIEYTYAANGKEIYEMSMVSGKEGMVDRFPTPDELRVQLLAIFGIQSTRTVNNDFTIQFKNTWYQLGAIQETTVFKGDTVTIEERLDGAVCIRLKETYLAYTPIPTRPKPLRVKITALTKEKPKVVPPPGHPWRKPFLDEKPRHAN